MEYIFFQRLIEWCKMPDQCSSTPAPIHHFCHFSSGNSVLHETKWQLLSPRGDQKRVKHETNQWPSFGDGSKPVPSEPQNSW